MNSPEYILATNKPWHDALFDHLKKRQEEKWFRVFTPGELFKLVEEVSPRYIFFPHWSHMIPEAIFAKYSCVIFHMTDLPYGRGGSPLQNLIINGHKETQISAIKAQKELDAGPVYLKLPLSLSGSAQEIFERSSDIILKMIKLIVKNDPIPEEQQGTPVIFKRRTPEMSDISRLTGLTEVYDYIRMLDAEGYPHAFMESENFKFEFTNAQTNNEEVIANVRIIKK